MPTIATHALLPLIGAAALPRGLLSRRLILAGMAAAVLPDADIVSRYFGIPHTHDFGHRGATHTLLFALLVGLAGASLAAKLHAHRLTAFLFLFAATLSHPLTDMLTNGGKGMMLLWPFADDRFVFPFRPVEVSPVGLRLFEDGRMWTVLASEAMWLLLPALVLARIVRNLGQRRACTRGLIDTERARP